jgi:hypothetical protein
MRATIQVTMTVELEVDSEKHAEECVEALSGYAAPNLGTQWEDLNPETTIAVERIS